MTLLIEALLRFVANTRSRLGLRAYFHDRCDRPGHRWVWHRVSYPEDGWPMLILCPRGAYRNDPAAWDLPFEERLVDDWADGSYRAADGSIHW